MRRRAGLAVAALVALGGAAAACADGGASDGPGVRAPDAERSSDPETPEVAEPPDDAEPYIEALAAAFAGPGPFAGLDDDQARCVATNYVAIVGVDRFEAAGITPEIIGRDPADIDAGDPELDLHIEREEADALYDGFGDCGYDTRAYLIESLLLEARDDESLRACLEAGITEDAVRELIVGGILGSSIAEQPGGARAYAAVQACATDDDGG